MKDVTDRRTRGAIWWGVIYATPVVAICLTVSIAEWVELVRFRPLSGRAVRDIATIGNCLLAVVIAAGAGVLSSPDARFERRLGSGAVYGIYAFLAYALCCVMFVFNR